MLLPSARPFSCGFWIVLLIVKHAMERRNRRGEVQLFKLHYTNKKTAELLKIIAYPH